MLGYTSEELYQTDIWNIIFPDIENNSKLKEHLTNLFKNAADSGEFEAIAADSVGNGCGTAFYVPG